MRLFLLCCIAVSCAPAQPSRGFDGKPFTTDDRIKTFEQWVKDDPSSISNQTLLAAAYIQKTRESSDFSYLDRAGKIVDAVLEKKRDFEALRLRNLIELSRHNFGKVVEYATEMTRSAPRDPQTWGSLGDALMEMGRYQDAEAAFSRMLSLKRSLFSLNRMAHYRFVMGDAAGAIEMMSEAARAAVRFPENRAWCLTELGTMNFKIGRSPEAEKAFREAIAEFPQAHSAHAGLGAIRAAEGKHGEAIASYRKAQSITPLIQYAAALRDLYLLTGNRAEAEKQEGLVDVVAKLEAAANQKANRTLALIYANQRRNLKEALEAVEADLVARKDVYTYDALAWVLHRLGRNEEARQSSRKALEHRTPEAMFLYHSGMISLALGDRDAARRDLDASLSLNPAFDLLEAEEARKALRALR